MSLCFEIGIVWIGIAWIGIEWVGQEAGTADKIANAARYIKFEKVWIGVAACF